MPNFIRIPLLGDGAALVDRDSIAAVTEVAGSTSVWAGNAYLQTPFTLDEVGALLTPTYDSDAGGWEEIAAQHAQNTAYYRDLLLEVAAHLGDEVYVQDDGGRADKPLVAKVPELVKKMAKDQRKMVFARCQDGTILSVIGFEGVRKTGGPGPDILDIGIEWEDYPLGCTVRYVPQDAYMADEPSIKQAMRAAAGGHVFEEAVAVDDGTGNVVFTTVRDCLGCGCLVPGGPTRCRRCAEESGERIHTNEPRTVGLLDLQKAAHAASREKGWWDDETRPDGTLDPADVRHLVPTKLALIHSEVSEALEDYRDGKMLTTFRDEDGKPEGFGSELADVLIRIFDLAEALDLNMEAEVGAKMAYNRCRPHRHGGKSC